MNDEALVEWLKGQTCPRCGARGGPYRLYDSYPLPAPPGRAHDARCDACEMRSTVEERPPGTFRWAPLE